MTDTLSCALLSLDAYYTDANGNFFPSSGTIDIPPNAGKSLGAATFVIADDKTLTSGYFGVEYALGGQIVIANRGANRGEDFFRALGLAGGFITDNCGDALAFYQHVNGSLSYNANITLTGHSLGGALAGYTVGNTGANAILFDNTGYLNALVSEQHRKYLAYQRAYGDWLRKGQIGAPPQPPTLSQPTPPAYNLAGETAGAIGNNPSTEINPFAGGDPVTLHSMALLVIYLDAYQRHDNTWNSVGDDLYRSLTWSRLATSAGVTGGWTPRSPIRRSPIRRSAAGAVRALRLEVERLRRRPRRRMKMPDAPSPVAFRDQHREARGKLNRLAFFGRSERIHSGKQNCAIR